jgi:hypothetical protein
MMPTPRLRRIALTLSLAAMAVFGAPAAATVIHGSSPGRSPAGMADATWTAAALPSAELPANVAALRLGAGQGGDCAGCGEALAAASRARPASATLSVNMAILVLGTLWVGLMLRRIQLRSAMDGLRGAAPRHAAGGH